MMLVAFVGFAIFNDTKLRMEMGRAIHMPSRICLFAQVIYSYLGLSVGFAF